jgi:Flp pilus assembly protein TadD
LRRALELDPAQPAALNNLARHYLGARREPAEALDLAQRLADVQPTAASYDLLGWALYVNGRTNEARTAAARAVELDPANRVYRERLERLGQQP